MNHLLRALAEATPQMKPKEPWRSYQAAVIRLRSQVAMVVLTMDPTHAYLIIDGRPYGKGDGRFIALSYGKHTIVGRAEGYEDATETRLVTPAGVPNIHLHLEPKKASAPAAPPVPAPAAPPKVPPAASPADTKPTPQAPFPCLPGRSVRGVLGPLACVTTAAFVATAATTIGLELHAASMRSGLAARGFEPNGCAPGHSEAGSAECTEILARVQRRVDATNVMIGTGVAAAVFAVGAGLSIALEPKAPTAPKVTATASTGGGGIMVHGAW